MVLFDFQRQDRLEAGERHKKKIRGELHYLIENRLPLLKSGLYTPDSLVTEEQKLNDELNALNAEEAVSDISMAETAKDVRKLSELIKDGLPIYDFANPAEKDRIIRTIFSELTLSENTLQYKCKKGFAALESRFVASGEELLYFARTHFATEKP